MSENILQVRNLSVSFGGASVVSGLNFSVEKGETLTIIGPNGAGKSVLFRALLGLLPYDGEVVWNKGVKIGYVPQKLSIEKGLPLSVLEFLKIKGSDDDVRDALNKTGIIDAHIFDRRLADLSGGEFQRVMIAWALIGNPDVLLFDEPLTGIDIGGEETIYNLLYRLGKDEGATILLISHDLSVVYKHSSKVLCLNQKQFCYGGPDEVIHSEEVKEIYGDMTTFMGHGHSHY